MKKILITFGIILVIFAGGLVVSLIPFFSAIREMHPVGNAKLSDNLIAIKSGFSNLYLVTDGDKAICIDAGADLKWAERGLARFNIPPGSVRAVFLTHGDSDHVAALKLFKNAEIYLSAAEEEMINGKKARFWGVIKNKLPVNTYSLLADGSVVSIGKIRIQAISTPGHTPGSMSYLVNGNILFTGDTLGLKDGRASLFPHVFNMDENTEKASITKIAGLNNVSFLCTGHHGITADFDNALKGWRKNKK